MIRIGKESNLSVSDVLDKAQVFFGSGEGMKISARDDCCARFQGGGGYVYVHAADLNDQDGSQVTIEGREWDFQIRQFIKGI